MNIRTRLCIVASLFLVSLPSWTNDSSKEEYIPWEPGRKLLWSDFRGKPDNRSSYFASTAYAVECLTEFREDTLLFQVRCFMRPDFSWVKNGAEKESLLQHEQLHFDIAELYTRMLRKEISETQFSLKTADKTFRAMNDKNSREREAGQSRYDKETRHSLNEEKQAEWNRKIAGELEALNKYSSTEVRVAVKSK